MALNLIEVMKLGRLAGDRAGEKMWTENRVVRRAPISK
jgi:hypothetical protein